MSAFDVDSLVPGCIYGVTTKKETFTGVFRGLGTCQGEVAASFRCEGGVIRNVGASQMRDAELVEEALI